MAMRMPPTSGVLKLVVAYNPINRYNTCIESRKGKINMYIKIYDRDQEELPEVLNACIVYWRKGCAGSAYFKGEVYGTANPEEQLISTDSDESLEVLIARLKSDVQECTCCHYIVDSGDICETGACEDCEARY